MPNAKERGERIRVSIVTVCFNSKKTLARAIQSVAAQSYPHIEYIVVDGGSSDGSLTLLQENSDVISKWTSERDAGIYDAMNKGWQMATGDVVGFLNSDDVLASRDAVQQIAQCFDNTDAQAVYGDLELVDDQGRVTRRWHSGRPRRFKYHLGWMPPHPSTYIRRSLFEDYGGFTQDLSIAADYELMLRFFYRHQARVRYLPQTLVRMLKGGVSNGSLFAVGLANWQVYKSWR
jgi:glycosyltransferase involved in cell wall biosynthesis